MKQILFFILCSLLTASRMAAQTETFSFKHLTIDNGLSHNNVTCFLKDRKGFLWIGTNSGLNRYDGYTIKTFQNDMQDSTSIGTNNVGGLFETPDGKIAVITSGVLHLYDPESEKFQVNPPAFYERYHLPAANLSSITKDHQGNYWFVHSAGIVWHDPVQNIFVPINQDREDTTRIANNTITGLAFDNEKNTWLIHGNGILERIIVNENKYTVAERNYFLFRKYKGEDYDYRITADRNNDLWIYAYNGAMGLFHFNVGSKIFTHLHQQSNTLALNTNIVRGVAQDNNGLIWIGTDHGGINLLDLKNQSIRYLLHNDYDEKSLGQNSITTLYKDDEGIIWVATFKNGLSFYHPNMLRFPLITNSPGDPGSLPFEDVNRFAEDKKGNLWIGTNGGGLIYFDRKKQIFKQFKHDPDDPRSLSGNVIVSLCIDHEDKLWVGTFYAGLNSYDGESFTRYTNDPQDPSTVSDQSIWEIYEDASGRLWIGTFSQGLDLFDRKTKTFTHYKAGSSNSVIGNYISVLTEDSEGNLWVGTSEGIDVLRKSTGRFEHMATEAGNTTSLSNNIVLDIKEDNQHNVWVGTNDGLNLYNRKTKRFSVFKREDGLPHNTILTILEDNKDNIWLSTPRGLTKINRPKNENDQYTFSNFDEKDGLQGKQFNENSAYKTTTGELIFGGQNGFNIFKTENLRVNTNPPKILLTDFQIYQHSLKPGEPLDGDILLKKSITEARDITLPFDKNFFTIEFAAINFFHPEKSEYQYILEGLHSDWLNADSKSRKVTFTNLDPGNYIFKVKAANNDGIWNNEGTQLNITILPPFWKTPAAFVMYSIMFLGLLFLIRKLIQQREKMKFAIEQERQEAIRLHELDMMKIKFFTNVSHEFRTPLTLILTPIERIVANTKDTEQQGQFRLIQRNAKRLLNLVNQLLDFRKLEVQEVKFNPSEGDIIQFIKETVYSFSDLSERKNISFALNTSIGRLETLFDQEKLEKILFNLLSNAFKFTPHYGKVTVSIAVEKNGDTRMLKIQVSDTGIGIPQDKKEKIFERFFQHTLPKSIVNQGSGIGLSITKEFVKIHGGTITVESEIHKGSCFTVLLPINEIPQTEEAAWVSTAIIGSSEESTHQSTENAVHNKPVLLLVEDNDDFRFYLKDNLKFEFTVIEATNGVAGWMKVIQHIPDLVVSDVMMPEMNGIELCRKIKTDERVSHIPVIILTARTEDEQRLEGIQTGADDYITKPFNFEILISRIRNLILQREKFHKAFPKQIAVKASELNITSLDTKFIERAIKYVEENVSNPDFSVEDLSHLLGISRANSYKKITSLTGKSPLEFIRTIRLQHAAQLLEKSQLTVAEVAYKVGFTNPKYFSRYFKETYQMLPSAYAMKKRKS